MTISSQNNAISLPEKPLRLRGFAHQLVNTGLLNETDAKAHLSAANQTHIPFIKYLFENHYLDARSLAQTAANYFDLPLFDLDSYDRQLMPKALIDKQLLESHSALPLFQRGHNLFIATADPTEAKLQDLQFHTGLNTVMVLVETDKLKRYCETILDDQQLNHFGDLSDTDLENIEISTDDTLANDEPHDADIEDAPIVQFIHKILLDAVHQNASDIHFEPYEDLYRIRFRMDGLLHEKTNSNTAFANQIAARLKVMSNLDISERRIPQDGRFKMNLGKTTIDFRISTCPVSAGEKIVVRLLDPSNINIGIEQLGFEQAQQALFLSAIKKPQGMILVTGPTGSGKTVSLYTALNLLNTEEKNISTIEDPVEINLKGINQVNINPKTGLSFSLALRAFLRQDPDIIMVGEMRDLETAEIAIKAAQTGHLVLSTLHTNSAPETVTRLIDMGVAYFNLASSVNLILAQRLARRLCQHCKEAYTVPEQTLLSEGFLAEEIPHLTIYRPKGCEHCTNGYKGRVGVYELMHMTDNLKQTIMSGANALAIKEKAIAEGMQTLHRSALNKVAEGLIGLEEVNRVIKSG